MVSVTGAYYIGVFVGVIATISIYELIKFVREYIKREKKNNEKDEKRFFCKDCSKWINCEDLKNVRNK